MRITLKLSSGTILAIKKKVLIKIWEKKVHLFYIIFVLLFHKTKSSELLRFDKPVCQNKLLLSCDTKNVKQEMIPDIFRVNKLKNVFFFKARNSIFFN